MDKQIANILKQNQSIHASLVSRNILEIPDLIILTDTMSLEEQKKLLTEENNKLKEIVKLNKPPEQPKESKPIQQAQQPKSKPKPKDDEESDDEIQEVQPKFSTITNMEDIKRAFFSGDYELFRTLLSAHQFKMYTGEYIFASDKDGAPDYSARNLIKGFVRAFDDYRKYFMICFRCYQHISSSQSTYTYPSLWIVNSNDSINAIIGSTADDYKLTEVTSDSIHNFLKSLEKLDPETPGLMAESYVH
jgi:hypothetical protein